MTENAELHLEWAARVMASILLVVGVWVGYGVFMVATKQTNKAFLLLQFPLAWLVIKLLPIKATEGEPSMLDQGISKSYDAVKAVATLGWRMMRTRPGAHITLSVCVWQNRWLWQLAASVVHKQSEVNQASCCLDAMIVVACYAAIILACLLTMWIAIGGDLQTLLVGALCIAVEMWIQPEEVPMAVLRQVGKLTIACAKSRGVWNAVIFIGEHIFIRMNAIYLDLRMAHWLVEEIPEFWNHARNAAGFTYVEEEETTVVRVCKYRRRSYVFRVQLSSGTTTWMTWLDMNVKSRQEFRERGPRQARIGRIEDDVWERADAGDEKALEQLLSRREFVGQLFDSTMGFPGEGPPKNVKRIRVEERSDPESEQKQTAVEEEPEAEQKQSGVEQKQSGVEQVGNLTLQGEALPIKILRVHKARQGGYVFRVEWTTLNKRSWMSWGQMSAEFRKQYAALGPKEAAIAAVENQFLQKQEADRKPSEAKIPAQNFPGKQATKRRTSVRDFRKVRKARREADAARLKGDKMVDEEDMQDVEMEEKRSKEDEQLEQLLIELDEAYVRSEEENKEEIAAFPKVASWATVCKSVNKYLELTTEPGVSRKVCCVCGEWHWERETTTYSTKPGGHDVEVPLLPDSVKVGMIGRLERPEIAKKMKAEWAEGSLKPFAQCVLEPMGIDSANGRVTLCNLCDNSLQVESLPKNALANDLWFGDIPDELKDLTWAEQKVIALKRVAIHIVNLRGSDYVSKRTRSRVLKLGKCNMVCLPHKATQIATVLPLPSDDMSTMIKVIFVNADGKLPPKIKLKWLLGVRQEKIRQALKWLKKWNPLYKDVEISEEQLSTYEDDSKDPSKDCIPDAFWKTIITSEQTKARDEDRAGYAEGAEESDEDVDESKEEVDAEDGIHEKVDMHKRGLVDVDAAEATVKVIGRAAREKLLVIPEMKQQPESMFNNPELYLGAFPELYPYGLGAPDMDRTRPISLEAYARHIVRLADPRFRMHSVLLFVVFKILQIQRATRSAKLSMKFRQFIDFEKHLKTITEESIQQCIKDLERMERKGKLPRMKDCKNVAARETFLRVFREANSIGGRLPLTAASKRHARAEIFGLMAR